MHIYLFICTFIYICTYIHTQTCIYTYIYMYIYIYIYVHIDIDIEMYTYTHTWASSTGALVVATHPYGSSSTAPCPAFIRISLPTLNPRGIWERDAFYLSFFAPSTFDLKLKSFSRCGQKTHKIKNDFVPTMWFFVGEVGRLYKVFSTATLTDICPLQLSGARRQKAKDLRVIDFEFR